MNPSDPEKNPNRSPKWMGSILRCAGAYNLLWGAFAIIFPSAIFRWAGFDPMPNYLELWQCIGMIVGVYGIGYLIAANDPVRHWPIVLVGLLGKILGPIGFLQAVTSGSFPAIMGWTILTNDLIWWLPFGAILWHAARSHQSRRDVDVLTVDTPDDEDLWQHYQSQFGGSLADLANPGPLLLVFLRHTGCIFCRETLASLRDARGEIEQSGASLAIVHPGVRDDPELFARYGLADIPRFRDESGQLYREFDLKLGTFRQLLGLRVWWRGFLTFLQGYGVGRLNGNGFRMPGGFWLEGGKIVRGHRLATAADRLDLDSLTCGVLRKTSP